MTIEPNTSVLVTPFALLFIEKRIIITNHAKKRMFERGINLNEIKSAIEFPDYTITKENKIEVYKNNLKVIYENKDKFIRIITIIKR
jgi:hypothetical protein